MSIASPAPERAHDGLSRRRILQGAAWAAPAIVLATAVPAAAGSMASAEPTLAGTFSGTATAATGTLLRYDNNSAVDITGVYLIVTYVHETGNNGQVQVTEANSLLSKTDVGARPNGGETGQFRLDYVGAGLNAPSGDADATIPFSITMSKVASITKVELYGTINGTLRGPLTIYGA